MATASPAPRLRDLQVSVTVRVYPPHDAMHGTPHPVIRRLFAFSFPEGDVYVEQTDYGHPGRFNPCHSQRFPVALQPRAAQILAAAQALAALLD